MGLVLRAYGNCLDFFMKGKSTFYDSRRKSGGETEMKIREDFPFEFPSLSIAGRKRLEDFA